MKKDSLFIKIIRYLLGIILFVFGLNGFLQFMPMPPAPEAAGSFLGALAATGYIFPLVKLVEVLAGVALLSNRFVPLALILFAPVAVNIFLFHAVLDPAGGMVAYLVFIFEILLLVAYKSYYNSFLKAKN